MDVQQVSETINLVFQMLMMVLPIAAVAGTWFLRNYAKSASSEKTVAAIIRLSNAAIDFAEDLDNRGELQKYLQLFNMPPEVLALTSDGLKKLNLAGHFLETELNKMGIKMTDEEAKAWVAAEFQRRTGDLGQERGTAHRIEEAVSLLRMLEQSDLIVLPTDVARVNLLANQVTSWVEAQLKQDPMELSREQALTQFYNHLAGKPEPTPLLPSPTVEARLAELAAQSLVYVRQLRADYLLTLPETDVALAWVLTEVTKQGLPVTTDQIARAVRASLEQAPV